MKRFWLILLSLGLIVAFSTSAMAVDVKFSGEYYATGMYLDKTTLNSSTTASTAVPSILVPVSEELRLPTPVRDAVVKDPGPSTAFYYQRLRLNTTFVISPGLMLITRADILERAWGSSRFEPKYGVGAQDTTLSSGTRAENENIAFDLAYVMYTSPIGIFLAGYQIDSAWGTVFGDNSNPTPKIGYIAKVGGLVMGLQTGKNPDGERSYGAFNGSVKDATDRDNNFYTGFFRYGWKGGEAGLLLKYIDNRTAREDVDPVFKLLPFGKKTQTLSSLPYIKAQLGPVALQAEVIWTYGKAKFEDEAKATAVGFLGDDEVKVNTLSAWIDGTADFGMVYAGGSLAYLSGDDPATKHKNEGAAGGGYDWNPCLIMFNNDLTYWAGSLGGYLATDATPLAAATFTSNGSPMTNAYFAQLRGGIRPVEKLDVMASVSWAKADKTPAAVWASREYGYEVDLTGTYKITNNLSYMLGAAYFFTGDYYKGVSDANDVDDNFMVINKLTLTF